MGFPVIAEKKNGVNIAAAVASLVQKKSLLVCTFTFLVAKTRVKALRPPAWILEYCYCMFKCLEVNWMEMKRNIFFIWKYVNCSRTEAVCGSLYFMGSPIKNCLEVIALNSPKCSRLVKMLGCSITVSVDHNVALILAYLLSFSTFTFCWSS